MHHFPRIVRRNTHNLLHQASHQLQEHLFTNEEVAEAAGKDVADDWRAPSSASSAVKSSVAPSPGGLLREPRKISWQDLNQATSPPTPIALEAVGAFRRSAPGSTSNLPGLALETSRARRPPMRRSKTQPATPGKTLFSHRGDSLLTVTDRGAVRVWDLDEPDTHVELGGLPVHAGMPTTVAFSPNDDYVLALPALSNAIYVWDLRYPETPFVLQAPAQITEVCFSRNGNRIAATCGEMIAVWQTHDLCGEPILLPSTTPSPAP